MEKVRGTPVTFVDSLVMLMVLFALVFCLL